MAPPFPLVLSSDHTQAIQANSVMQTAALGDLTTALNALKVATNVVSWIGAARGSQGMQAGDIATKVQQLIGTTGQAGTTTGAAATQLQAQKTQIVALVRSAVAGRYTVLPSGQVIMGGSQIAEVNALRAAKHYAAAAMRQMQYQTGAATYTARIQALMGQTAMTDAQAAVALLKAVVDLFTQLSGKDAASATASAQLLPQIPTTMPGTGLAGAGGTLTGALPLGGTSLTGVSTLSGAGFALSGAGGAGSPGAGLVGVGMTGVGMTGVGSAMASAGSAGARGGVGATGRGPGAGVPGGVVGAPYGAHGSGDGDQDEYTTSLVNDNDIFAVDTAAPGPVLGGAPEA